MIASDVLTPVRVNLDDGAKTTWTDNALFAYLLEAVTSIHTEESESRFNAQGIPQDQGAITALGDSVVLDALYLPALIHYVSARAYEGEASDERDTKQATLHWSRWDAFFQPVEQ